MPTATKPTTVLHRLIASLLRKQKAQVGRTPTFMPVWESDSQTERRRTKRRNYYYWQLLAFCDGRRLPPQPDFRLIQCRDLSPKGFSFFSESLPRHKKLVIALGTVPFQFFEAEVVRRESARREGLPGWILGCRFVRQVTGSNGFVA